jgi:hypothetical protein
MKRDSGAGRRASITRCSPQKQAALLEFMGLYLNGFIPNIPVYSEYYSLILENALSPRNIPPLVYNVYFSSE